MKPIINLEIPPLKLLTNVLLSTRHVIHVIYIVNLR